MVEQPQVRRRGASRPPSLTIRDTDLAHAISALRATPAAELSAIRTLHIILTETSLLRWNGPIWPESSAVFDDEDYDDYERLYPAPPSIASSPPSEQFRELLRFIAESFELGELDLQVNLSNVAWSLFEGKAAAAYYPEDKIDQDWKFIYDFFMDVGRALAEVFGGLELRKVDVETSIWDGMGGWLTGQISGRETVVDGNLPEYHNVGIPLLSNEGGVKAT